MKYGPEEQYGMPLPLMVSVVVVQTTLTIVMWWPGLFYYAYGAVDSVFASDKDMRKSKLAEKLWAQNKDDKPEWHDAFLISDKIFAAINGTGLLLTYRFIGGTPIWLLAVGLAACLGMKLADRMAWNSTKMPHPFREFKAMRRITSWYLGWHVSLAVFNVLAAVGLGTPRFAKTLIQMGFLNISSPLVVVAVAAKPNTVAALIIALAVLPMYYGLWQVCESLNPTRTPSVSTKKVLRRGDTLADALRSKGCAMDGLVGLVFSFIFWPLMPSEADVLNIAVKESKTNKKNLRRGDTLADALQSKATEVSSKLSTMFTTFFWLLTWPLQPSASSCATVSADSPTAAAKKKLRRSDTLVDALQGKASGCSAFVEAVVEFLTWPFQASETMVGGPSVKVVSKQKHMHRSDTLVAALHAKAEFMSGIASLVSSLVCAPYRIFVRLSLGTWSSAPSPAPEVVVSTTKKHPQWFIVRQFPSLPYLAVRALHPQDAAAEVERLESESEAEKENEETVDGAYHSDSDREEVNTEFDDEGEVQAEEQTRLRRSDPVINDARDSDDDDDDSEPSSKRRKTDSSRKNDDDESEIVLSAINDYEGKNVNYVYDGDICVPVAKNAMVSRNGADELLDLINRWLYPLVVGTAMLLAARVKPSSEWYASVGRYYSEQHVEIEVAEAPATAEHTSFRGAGTENASTDFSATTTAVFIAASVGLIHYIIAITIRDFMSEREDEEEARAQDEVEKQLDVEHNQNVSM